MIPRKHIDATLASYRKLKDENPDLLNEDINAIIVAASNSAVAEALSGGPKPTTVPDNFWSLIEGDES